jgi:AcrR family transcriptional regulator
MSPRNSEQNEEIRQKRQRQILVAATQIYLEKGVLGTEIGEVAKRAGIARGLVYYYYKDKLVLFRALFDEAMSATVSFVKAQMQTDEAPLQKLTNYVEHYVRAALESPGRIKFFRNLNQDIPVVYEEQGEMVLKRFMLDIHQPLENTFRQAMEEGSVREGDPRLTTQIFWGGISGAMMAIIELNHPKEEADELTKQITKMLFEGILVRRMGDMKS